LQRFEQIYGNLGKTGSIIAIAIAIAIATSAAHHRLLWIHPFLDGNGRVTRLMSDAILLETLDTGAVWPQCQRVQGTVGQLRPSSP